MSLRLSTEFQAWNKCMKKLGHSLANGAMVNVALYGTLVSLDSSLNPGNVAILGGTVWLLANLPDRTLMPSFSRIRQDPTLSAGRLSLFENAFRVATRDGRHALAAGMSFYVCTQLCLWWPLS